MNTVAEQKHRLLSQFRIIFGAMRDHFRKLEASTGLPGTEVWVLHLVNSQKGISINEIADAMYVHQSTASNLIAALVRKQLLIKNQSPADRRVMQLVLTEQGATLLAKAPEPREGLLPAVIEKLSASDQAQLDHSLQQLIDLLPELVEGNEKRPLASL